MPKVLIDAVSARGGVPLELALVSAKAPSLMHTTISGVRDFVYLTVSNSNPTDVDVLIYVGPPSPSNPPVRVRAPGRQYAPVPALQNRAIGGGANAVQLYAVLNTVVPGNPASSGVHIYGYCIRT